MVLLRILVQIHEEDFRSMVLKCKASFVECYNCHKLGHFARSAEHQEARKLVIRVIMIIQNIKSDKHGLMTFSELEAITYKRGLDTVEAQLVTYRKNEVLFSEEVAILKREASKDLDQLLGSQITDKSKKGLD
ncbi:hypothetical protein Tco_1102829 [Tanacetum coccineum]